MKSFTLTMIHMLMQGGVSVDKAFRKSVDKHPSQASVVQCLPKDERSYQSVRAKSFISSSRKARKEMAIMDTENISLPLGKTNVGTSGLDQKLSGRQRDLFELVKRLSSD